MYVFNGVNPTRMYYDALNKLVKSGDEVSPRGKLVKELRPAVFEYEYPLNRVTFLGSRRINPFFQVAESLWILSGKSDVDWLCKFNANMKEFSDNGVDFNAPYGERIRAWNQNNAHNIIINPIDQLLDVYKKLENDKDTRQAVVVISNPMFDNSNYTIGEKGKDIACNLVFTFKIRNDKLDITVFNRSNDLHWGVMGANLCQFSTIQEVVARWLGVSVGRYCQITDSLHIYLDTYGSKCTDEVMEYYSKPEYVSIDADFTCVDEPRMSLEVDEFHRLLECYWTGIDPFLMDDDYLKSCENIMSIREFLSDLHFKSVLDDYWYFVIKSMLAYRLNKLGNLEACMDIVSELVNCQIKVSMMYFMKNFVKKANNPSITDIYNETVKDLLDNLVNPQMMTDLEMYLSLEE